MTFSFVGNRTLGIVLSVLDPRKPASAATSKKLLSGPLCKERRKELDMSDAAYFRAQAELCFSIALALSDPAAAETTLTLANDYVRRAEEAEALENDDYLRSSAKHQDPTRRTQPKTLS